MFYFLRLFFVFFLVVIFIIPIGIVYLSSWLISSSLSSLSKEEYENKKKMKGVLGPFRFGAEYHEFVLPRNGFLIEAKAKDIYKKQIHTVWGIVWGRKFFGYMKIRDAEKKG